MPPLLPANQELTLDPADSPLLLLDVQSSTGKLVAGTPYYLTSHAFPMPTPARLMASALETEGEVPGETHWSNRQIPVGFDVIGVDRAGLQAAMRALEQKIGKLSVYGGVLQWRLPIGDSIYFDLTGVDAYEPSVDHRFYNGDLISVALTLQARPFGYGTETLLGTWSETTNPVLVFATPAVPGDVPAIGRLDVTDGGTSTNSKLRTVQWGLQNARGGYVTGKQAQLYYEAETGFNLDAADVADAAAINGQAIRMTLSTANVEGELATIDRGTGDGTLQLAGTFRVFARARSDQPVRLAARWYPSFPGISQLWEAAPNERNAWSDQITATGTEQWDTLDLGLVTFRADRRGGGIQLLAMTPTPPAVVTVDSIWLVPTERYGAGMTSRVIGNHFVVTNREARFDNGSTTFYDPEAYVGDYLTLPPGVNRFAVAAPVPSAEFDPTPASDVTANLYVTPRYLTIPD